MTARSDDKPNRREGTDRGISAASQRESSPPPALAPRPEALPPQRYNVSVYEDSEYEFWPSPTGDWVKWDDIASLYGPSVRKEG